MASANVGIKEEPGEGVGLEQRLVLDNYSFGYYRSFIDIHTQMALALEVT